MLKLDFSLFRWSQVTKRSYYTTAVLLCLVSAASHAALRVIGTYEWRTKPSPTYRLIYDDNGRRAPDGTINGGLIWLDHAYNKYDMFYNATLGTGESARRFAQDLTEESPTYEFSLKPGFTIHSWDGPWRLPHAGTNPTSNPKDSEMLHLVAEELGNPVGTRFYNHGVFENIMWHSPSDQGSGFYGYWLHQDKETSKGTEIWYNTAEGRQETVPAAFHGGYALFVRSATVSFDSSAAGAADADQPAPRLEGYIVSAGTSRDLDAFREPHSYTPAAGRMSADIVGMAMAGSDDHIYAWHRDGTVSSGSPSDLDAYRSSYTYSLPPGKTPVDIVGMGITGSDDHVYAWYRDGTVSAGTSSDLDAYRAPYRYTLAPGKTPADIVEMGIAGSNDRVYTWYRDASVSAGTSSDLDAHRVPYHYTLPAGKTITDITGMAIAGSNDHVYTWYGLSIK